MAGYKGIILTLGRIGKGTQSLELPIRVETVATTRQNLMRVGLMPDIPHQLILRCIKYIMQRHGQLNRAQRRCQVSRIMTERADNKIPQLVTNCRQRLLRQLLQVGRGIDLMDILVLHP